ncbi:DNA repair-scaffolding protein isoform X2 [Neoarius graeffei]|uniref:DNA repair-scaffolding protein isoform X2 n=1 Tax=Neoarius graeffei TaxID=443677 RepID=UPI00298D14F7|nr:DNA repair-scaffolding protein isoform X2 [Neoarius graeffei]
MSSFSKRKRNTRDMRCVLFPEDVRETFIRRGSCETPKATKSSWERCGDSFLDTPVMEVQGDESTHAGSVLEFDKNVCLFFFQKHDATRQTSRAVQQLAQTSTFARPGCSGDQDPVHIAWTSSEDEQSDSERQLPLPLTSSTKASRRSRPTVRASSKYGRFLNTAPDPDEVLSIDSESEHEDVSTSKQHRSAVTAEISDYSSDSDGDPDTSRLDSPAQEPGAEQQQKSISEWVRSAQALLQTPAKQTTKPSKTPEDSGKKKRKFESQGLAERLNRLQCRQKSAVSFWRHQPVSSMTTGTEERPGVLVLHVQNVWDVCGMQAALCHGHPERQTCVALFSKETATHLAPSAGDTIHICPPWQSLTVDGEHHPIILNTHFSQKVFPEAKQNNSATCSKVLRPTKTKPYPLTRCLWKRKEIFKSSQASIPNKQARGNAEGVFDSLLEALEACGTSGSVCGPVEVVVQRVYFDSVVQFPHTSLLRHRALSKCVTGTAQQQEISRCCLLVQDMYGMFSEVEMQCASSEEERKDLTEQLQGKVCLLQGLKVIQRLTRERCAQLFSLTDSLWPPVVPLRVPGEGSCDQTVKVKGAAPSFCYRLSGQRDCVFPKSESPLYRAPLIQTLRAILQDDPASRRCSFKGTLVYKREQNKEEKDLLLFVTDCSLQDEQSSGSLSRTLPVYVSSMFLLQTSVRHAIAALSPQFKPRLIFRDAVIEQGKIIISGQSVIQLDSEPRNISSPRAVLLDQLSPESPPCSLCTVTGVVMDVDENSAFSWPACARCGGDGLEAFEDQPGVFLCAACGVVDKPSRKMQLEVFLSCPSSTRWTIKVKLQQNSIMSLLDSSTGHAEGYEVEAVLGKSVGPLSAFVRAVTRSSAVWMGLDEITL